MSSVTEHQAEYASLLVYRFTVDQYRRLGESGILRPDDRVEFLEGWIVPKMNHNPLHDGTIELVEEKLRNALPKDWRCYVRIACFRS